MEMINKYWAAQALALDIEMLQCESALSAISIESEANAKRAELKVMCENGTYDDLFELYREASAEASDKKKNIFVRMIEAIGNFINSVVSKIGELFNKHKLTPEEENAQIEVPYKKGFPGAVQKAGNAITSTIDKVVNGQGNIVDISKLVGAIAGIMGAVGGGIFAFNNIRKGLAEKQNLDQEAAERKAAKQAANDVSSTTTKKEATDDCNKINAVLRAVNKKLDSIKSRFEKPHEGFLKSTDGASAKKDNVFKTLFTLVSDWSHAVSKKVTDTTSKIFSKLKPTEPEPEGDEHEESKFAPGQEPKKSKGRRKKRNQQRDQRSAANAAQQTQNDNTYDAGNLAKSAEQRQKGQNEDENTTGESVDDTIDVSDDEGMAAFEAALDEIVNGEMDESADDNDDIEDETEDDDNDADATDEEVDAAFESVAEEFDALFNEDDDDEEGDE